MYSINRILIFFLNSDEKCWITRQLGLGQLDPNNQGIIVDHIKRLLVYLSLSSPKRYNNYLLKSVI